MARQIKVSAKFGSIISRKAKFAKFNKKIRGKMRRRCSTDQIMNECKLRGVLFHHYGNIMQNLNNFLFGSTKNIITKDVRDFRDVKIMMLSTHDSHNEIE